MAQWRGNASRPKEPPSPFRTRTGPYFKGLTVAGVVLVDDDVAFAVLVGLVVTDVVAAKVAAAVAVAVSLVVVVVVVVVQ